jgi:hypothetical protein
LVLVMTASAPLRPPTCISLAGVDEVRFGRGPRYQVAGGGSRQLVIELADPATSSSHARLTRVERGWVIADDGSKNGTLVNGRRVTRAELGPDDSSSSAAASSSCGRMPTRLTSTGWRYAR